MAIFRPFAAIRPDRRAAAKVAALPYDVYNREEARTVTEGHPLSFLNIDRPETQFPPDTDIYAPCVYEKAGELLRERIADGTFIREKVPAYYLYTLTMNGKSQTGIVGCCSLDDYLSGAVRRHENTRADKELDRVRHVKACGAQTGPVFLAYRNNGTLRELTDRALLREALYDFTAEDGIRHQVRRIDRPEECRAVADAFAAAGTLYIADGHHRAAAAVRVGLERRAKTPGYTGEEEFNFFLAAAFPDDELTIMDYNRLVADLNGLDREAFLARLRESFTAEPSDTAVRPARKGEFGLYLAGRWYRLTAREELRAPDEVGSLDVSFLQERVLAPILNITEPRTDRRIDFSGGIRGLDELKRRVDGGMAAAFALFPTSIGELFAVADAGKLMPPKSTWFEPKLRSGLLIHSLDGSTPS